MKKTKSPGLAEFDSIFGPIFQFEGCEGVISYKSKQSLESLYYLYFDYLMDAEGFFTFGQNDGKLYSVGGIKYGKEIAVNVSLSMGNCVMILVKPHIEY